jgi:hypothetical protein
MVFGEPLPSNRIYRRRLHMGRLVHLSRNSTAGGGLNWALIPICAKDAMADPEAVAELKVKRLMDYDDVVRDYRKRTGTLEFELRVQQGLR